jgi:cytochrome c oxidase subunit 2
LSTLDPAGPGAARVATLWWAMLAGAGAILALVCVLLVLAFRPPQQVRPSRWIVGGGLVFTTCVLAVLTIWGVVLGEGLIARERPDTVRVEANARQWFWTFRHPGADGPIETLHRLYIPAGRAVDVALSSEDVIHSFWVPRLAGKMDAIPGKNNVLRIEADTPGEYAAICAEYCGVGHRRMQFRVIALPPERWDAMMAEGAR